MMHFVSELTLPNSFTQPTLAPTADDHFQKPQSSDNYIQLSVNQRAALPIDLQTSDQHNLIVISAQYSILIHSKDKVERGQAFYHLIRASQDENLSKETREAASQAISILDAQYHLKDLDLRSKDLSKLDLSHLRLKEVDLSDAILIGTKFNETKLTSVILTGANLTDSKFIKAELLDVKMDGVVLFKADMSEAILVKVNLSNSNLHQAVLINAKLIDTDLPSADLSEAKLNNATMIYVTLDDAICDYIDLTETIQFRVDLNKARSMKFAQLDQLSILSDTVSRKN